jgi:prenyltransferase beta subunit
MKRPVLRIGEAIRTTISLQQADGLFGYETGQGGEDCLDYDAIMILSNLSLMDRRHEQAVKTAFQKCLQGIMVCKNIDGGFACHRRNETYYFGTKTTAVAAGKSSLWATYSRLLTIAMIMNHLYPETRPAWRLGANLLEVWDGGTGFIRKEQT